MSDIRFLVAQFETNDFQPMQKDQFLSFFVIHVFFPKKRLRLGGCKVIKLKKLLWVSSKNLLRGVRINL